MYLGIDLHKRYAQVAVIDNAGKIVEEVRVENANLDDLGRVPSQSNMAEHGQYAAKTYHNHWGVWLAALESVFTDVPDEHYRTYGGA